MSDEKFTIRRTKRMGRGVFNDEYWFVSKGSPLFECPVIVVPDDEARRSKTVQRYAFYWSPTESAIAAGVGSFINHSKTPNVYWKRNYKKQTITFYAAKNLKRREQLLMDYGYDPRTRRSK